MGSFCEVDSVVLIISTLSASSSSSLSFFLSFSLSFSLFFFLLFFCCLPLLSFSSPILSRRVALDYIGKSGAVPGVGEPGAWGGHRGVGVVT